MSVELNDQKIQDSRSSRSKTADLERKLMEVGSQQYHVDMWQNQESRFFTILEGQKMTRINRIAVPMLFAVEFSQKLYEVVKFASTYTLKGLEVKDSREQLKPVFSTKFQTPGERRYYFDVKESEECLVLRISYVFDDRRYHIHIVVDALSDLIKLIESFHENFPSISSSDDYPPRGKYRRRFDTGANSRGRGSIPYTSRHYNKSSRYDQGSAPSTNGKTAQPGSEGTQVRRTGFLKVLADPMPVHLVDHPKRISLEIVEGTRTFLRITEFINNNKKSTLHVPVELCGEFQKFIGEMQSKYNETRKSSDLKQ